MIPAVSMFSVSRVVYTVMPKPYFCSIQQWGSHQGVAINQHFILITAPFASVHVHSFPLNEMIPFRVRVEGINIPLRERRSFELFLSKYPGMGWSLNFPFALWAVIDLSLPSSVKVNRFLNTRSRRRRDEKLMKRRGSKVLGQWAEAEIFHVIVTLMYSRQTLSKGSICPSHGLRLHCQGRKKIVIEMHL